MLANEIKDFKNIVEQIKQEINKTKYEIFKNANMNLLKLYYNIGKTINENSSWGNKFIDELAIELKLTFPNMKDFSVRNLKNMKEYYIEYSKNEKVQTSSAQNLFDLENNKVSKTDEKINKKEQVHIEDKFGERIVSPTNKITYKYMGELNKDK